MASGYVDWNGLLREFIEDLNLDPDKETDLVTIAQFHCNQVGGKGALTQRIFDEFSKTKEHQPKITGYSAAYLSNPTGQPTTTS